jgi:retron-type reverse transcriptase
MAAQAARAPARGLPSLASLIAAACLREASRHTRQSSAAGIAGVTAPQEAEHREEHRRERHERRRSGRDQAPPVERVWIAQDDGGQRPIGQPAVEDTSGQRAVAMRRDAIEAQDCPDGASGVRRGRRPHDALQALRERGMREGIGWIVEAESSGYFARIARPRYEQDCVNGSRRGVSCVSWGSSSAQA